MYLSFYNVYGFLRLFVYDEIFQILAITHNGFTTQKIIYTFLS